MAWPNKNGLSDRLARSDPSLTLCASTGFLIESGRRTRGRVFASITRPRMWLAVMVALASFCVFLDRPRIPDLDELLPGALSPVVDLEVWRR